MNHMSLNSEAGEAEFFLKNSYVDDYNFEKGRNNGHFSQTREENPVVRSAFKSALLKSFKPMSNVILRGGVNFENARSSAEPSVNIGANVSLNNVNINAAYQQVPAEPVGTFAISAGINF